MTLQEKAERLGLTCRDVVALGQEDPRLVANPTLDGGGAGRLRRWLDAGRPAADLDRLCYLGDPEIGRAVRAVVAGLPEPVAHHAVTGCAIVGVGVDTAGWAAAVAPDLPTPEAQFIALASTRPGIIAHEIAHSWHRPLRRAPQKSAAALERDAEALHAELAAAAIENGRVDALVQIQLEGEFAADAAATAWGYPVDTCGPRRLELVRRAIWETARLAV